jgi:hypothetical protein
MPRIRIYIVCFVPTQRDRDTEELSTPSPNVFSFAILEAPPAAAWVSRERRGMDGGN